MGSKTEQYKLLHASRDYGVTSTNFFPLVAILILDLKPNSVLDYGCGQSNLYKKVIECGFTNYHRFDPAITDISTIALEKYDLLINTDVLEHIQKDELDNVLKHMQSLADNVFFSIAMYPAKTILPSGENAHCTVENASWWLNTISTYFPDANIIYNAEGRECGIITWKENLPGVYNEIYGFKIERKKFQKTIEQLQPFYKKFPKKWWRSIKKRI